MRQVSFILLITVSR